MMPTRFIMEEASQEPVDILDPQSANKLGSAMHDEASKHISKHRLKDIKGDIGGKTGTPMRGMRGTEVRNDGWYICYIRNEADGRLLAVAVRLERLPRGINSAQAVAFVNDVVFPVMKECGYIDF